MQAQAQAALQDFFSGAPGEKLKTAATAQLLLSLLLTFWAGNLSGALALLGLLAVVLSNSEFLRLVSRTLYLCTASGNFGRPFVRDDVPTATPSALASLWCSAEHCEPPETE